jgi:hypothetical protein
MRNAWRRSHGSGVEPPIELRFVDLFMILLTTLIFISVILSVISAGIRVTDTPAPPRVATRPVPPPRAARPPSPLRVVAANVLLPRAAPEEPYRTELRITGGLPPYRWQLVKGKLPPGVSWSPRGLVHGTPEDVEATGEDFSFVMRAMDKAGRQVTQGYTLAVRPPAKSPLRKRIEKVLTVVYIGLLVWWFWSGAYFPGVRSAYQGWKERRSYR